MKWGNYILFLKSSHTGVMAMGLERPPHNWEVPTAFLSGARHSRMEKGS